jgi:ABC-type enterobactin transport system permease subunit
MKKARRQRPPGITTLSLFEFLGTLGCIGLLFFTPPGSRDFIALTVGAVLGVIVVYGLWGLHFWAFWTVAVYESVQIAYELFLLTQPEYRNVHLLGPLFGTLLSALTLGYLFLDRSIKPIFRKDTVS